MESVAESSKSNKVFRILNHLYNSVETLEQFARRVLPTEVLQQENDDPSYVKLLQSTLVCFPPSARLFPQSCNVLQHSEQNELVLRVVERIRRREGTTSTNLLTVGYYMKSDKSAAQISSSSYSTEYGFSNNNVSRLLHAHWKTLLARIGDDAMEYLLEYLVIFVFVSGSCYIQMNGTPLYELWPFRRYCAPSSQRSSAAKQLCNSVLNDSKSKRLFRSQLKKGKSRSQSNINNVFTIDPVAREINTGGNMTNCLSSRKRKLRKMSAVQSDKKRCCVGDSFVLAPTSSTSAMGVNCPTISPQLHCKSPDASSSHESPSSSCYLSAHELPNSVCTVFLSATSAVESSHAPGTCIPAGNCDSGSTVENVTIDPLRHERATVDRYSLFHSSDNASPQTEQGKLAIGARSKRPRVRKGKLSAGERRNNEVVEKKTVPFSSVLCIDRTALFYSKNLSEPFLPRYILSGFVSGDSTKLADQIVCTAVDRCSFPSRDSALNRASTTDCCDTVKSKLVNLARILITNHRACPYKRLLNFHCKNLNDHSTTVGSSDTFGSSSTASDLLSKCDTKDSSGKTLAVENRLKKKTCKRVFQQHSELSTVNQLLEKHCSYREVYLFVRACCLRVIPTNLFGSKSNRNVFFRNVCRFIGMGRYEQLSLGVLMTGMKVTHCHWMAELHSNDSRLRLMAKVVYWLMSTYVLKLLRSYFYVTDTAVYKNRMFYYRKSVWRKIHCKGLSQHMRKRIFQRITVNEAVKSVQSRESLGFASLRFLPKLKGLRPIVNMSHRRKIVPSEIPINYQLRDLHQIFTSKRPLHVGSSVFSLDDIWSRWKRLVDSRRRLNDTRPLYFVKVDIEDCYDSIDQCRLYEIASRLLGKSDAYAVRRYVTVVAAGGRLKRSFHRDATPLTDFRPNFMRFVREKIDERQSDNVIFVDQVWYSKTSTEALLSRLKAHLFHNIISVDREYFRQVRGIAQGSVLSTLLCDIYYGDMETNRIAVNEEEELLMRQVDDFLFVTPVYSAAVTFLDLMTYGVDDYNCRINKRKTLTNFPVEDVPGEVRIQRLSDCALFPWCGLLINTATLAVHTDFTRYAGVHISDTITVDLARNPGRAMLDKLLFSLRSRCHRIYLDADINPDDAIAINIYRVFLLAAFKFHQYVKQLPVRNNPAFLINTIYEISRYVEVYAQKATKHKTLEKNAVRYLCLEAFHRKFQRHQGGYGFVLKAVRKRLRKLKRVVGVQRLTELGAAVGSSMPAEFECMIG